jgi:arsenate reductase
LLRERGVEFDAVDYMKEPLDRAGLANLLDLLSGPAADLVRKDKRFKELGLDEKNFTTARAVADLLAEHPALMQRPVAVRGGKAVIARPPEKVLELLEGKCARP